MADDALRAWRGRRVVLDPQDYPQHPGTFEVLDARRTANGDVFVKVANGRGASLWVKSDELEPAPALPTGAQDMTSKASAQLLTLANHLRSTKRLDLSAALKEAARTLPDAAQSWREDIHIIDLAATAEAPAGDATAAVRKLVADVMQRMPSVTPAQALEKVLAGLLAKALPASFAKATPKSSPTSQPSVNLSFDAVVAEHARVHHLSLGQAAKVIGRTRPDLAAQREAAF